MPVTPSLTEQLHLWISPHMSPTVPGLNALHGYPPQEARDVASALIPMFQARNLKLREIN